MNSLNRLKIKFSSELETNNNYERARKGSLVVSLTLQHGLASQLIGASPFSFSLSL